MKYMADKLDIALLPRECTVRRYKINPKVGSLVLRYPYPPLNNQKITYGDAVFVTEGKRKYSLYEVSKK